MSAAQNEFNELMRDKERRTRHPEDDDIDDAQSFLHLSDDDATPPASRAASDDEDPRPSMSSARSTIPRTRYGANTGPKGVISDAQDYRDSQRQHRASLRTQASQAQRGANLQDKPIAEKLEESDGEDDLDDDLDDDFMQRWRRGRLQELQNGRRDSQMHNRGRDRRVWGKLVAVDGEGYLEAIEKSPVDTVVVVYIYDSYVRLPTPALVFFQEEEREEWLGLVSANTYSSRTSVMPLRSVYELSHGGTSTRAL